MKQKIIKKTQKLLKLPPNLKDYSKTTRSFTWNEAEKELSWFKGKKLNAAYNALDRQALGENKNKIALYWEGENGEKENFTFGDLFILAGKFGNFLKSLGIKPQERVFFFLPRIPALYWGFLGTLRIGAIAGTLFAAFGPQALYDRLKNSGAKVVVTTKELYPRLEKIEKDLPDLKKIVFADNLERLLNRFSAKIRCRPMHPSDPAFMLYTSGTTGKPKGVIHAHQAILVQHLTAKWVLDLKQTDIYWCTADPGWVTGIAYGILGSWSNGVTALVYEGRFNPEKWYQLIQDYKVTVWYTAPTAIRMLAAAGKSLLRKYNFSSLRHLASVGEPLNPEAVWWGLEAFGLPFHDNWWQTETGGILIANYPCMDIKPGSMGKPIPGITAEIVDDSGKKLGIGKIGNLAIKPPWPSMMRTIWRRPKKYKSYFINNWYITGDLAYKDKDGYFWFVGRADDVIKTSGERVGPFEVESCLLEHPAVVESGVIGKPDPIRGEIIKAFVVLKKGWKPSEKLKEKLQQFVKTRLAGHAYPREIEFIDKLPKTRSGKIVRRILKAKELGLPIGDTSTLEEY
jgi:acetyl-CoA synthetase